MVLAACGASPEDGKTTSRAAEATEATAQQLVADIPVDLAEDEVARGYVIIPAGMVPVPAGQVAQEGSGYPRLAPGMVEVPYKVLPIPQGIGLPAGLPFTRAAVRQYLEQLFAARGGPQAVHGGTDISPASVANASPPANDTNVPLASGGANGHDPQTDYYPYYYPYYYYSYPVYSAGYGYPWWGYGYPGYGYGYGAPWYGYYNASPYWGNYTYRHPGYFHWYGRRW